MQFKKSQKTKILPLRWFANLCEKSAHYHLDMAMHYNDHDDNGLTFKYHAILSNWLYKPYIKWGTMYEVDWKEDS